MRSGKVSFVVLIVSAVLISGVLYSAISQARLAQNAELDQRVKQFLENNRFNWRDMNVSETDGQILYELVINNGYRQALEIGTSTGHSTIWIAWALSKTGGRLITIEIDEERYLEAVENLKAAGLDNLVEARLGDAHDIVPSLEGPFDFVFCDADKDWYKNYLRAVIPKLEIGGCFVAHNVRQSRGSRWVQPGIAEFLDYANSRPDLETVFEPRSRAGISITYKRQVSN